VGIPHSSPRIYPRWPIQAWSSTPRLPAWKQDLVGACSKSHRIPRHCVCWIATLMVAYSWQLKTEICKVGCLFNRSWLLTDNEMLNRIRQSIEKLLHNKGVSRTYLYPVIYTLCHIPQTRQEHTISQIAGRSPSSSHSPSQPSLVPSSNTSSWLSISWNSTHRCKTSFSSRLYRRLS